MFLRLSDWDISRVWLNGELFESIKGRGNEKGKQNGSNRGKTLPPRFIIQQERERCTQIKKVEKERALEKKQLSTEDPSFHIRALTYEYLPFYIPFYSIISIFHSEVSQLMARSQICQEKGAG